MRPTNADYPRISIALATYNGATYLPQLLESLSQQTLQPVEVVAVDDCSTDDTLAVLRQFGQRLPLTVHVNERSVGVVDNFRRAVAHCRGAYVAFCDQDDVWLPDKLAQSLEALRQIDGPYPAMVFTDLIVVDEHLNCLADSYWHYRGLKPAKETFTSLLYGNVVTGCTMLINRPMMEEVARMPATVLMHDFWIACVAYGVGRCTFVAQPTLLYRQHASNVTSNEAVTWRTRWRRLSGFLFDGQRSAHFLQPEVEQARRYADLYADRLSPDKQEALKQLFSVGQRAPFIRKCQTFLIKFLHIHA